MIANIENRSFMLLLVFVTVGFLWLLAPFYSAIFWAAIIAILFSPIEKRISKRLQGKATLSALLTMLASLLLVVIPLLVVLLLLGIEAVNVYQYFTSNHFSIQPYLNNLLHHFPFLEHWAKGLNINITSIRDTLSSTALVNGQLK